MTPTALIADDERHLRKVFSKLLQQKGYRVCEAASSKAAIELIRNILFDLIIVDQLLPKGPTGIEILARHKHLSPGGVRVLLTGFHSDELRNRCQEINAFYVEKPTMLTELIDQIQLVIRIPQARAGVRRKQT